MTDSTPASAGNTEQEPRPAVVAIYEESAARPVAGGRWHVQADDRVLYERRPGSGEFEPSIIDVEDLRSKPTWRVVGT